MAARARWGPWPTEGAGSSGSGSVVGSGSGDGTVVGVGVRSVRVRRLDRRDRGDEQQRDGDGEAKTGRTSSGRPRGRACGGGRPSRLRRSRACGPVGSSPTTRWSPQRMAPRSARCCPIPLPACRSPAHGTSIHRRGCGRPPRGASRAVYGKRLNQAAARPAPPITSTSLEGGEQPGDLLLFLGEPDAEPASPCIDASCSPGWRREEPASGRVGHRSERRLVRRDRHRLGAIPSGPRKPTVPRPCRARMCASARRRPGCIMGDIDGFGLALRVGTIGQQDDGDERVLDRLAIRARCGVGVRVRGRVGAPLASGSALGMERRAGSRQAPRRPSSAPETSSDRASASPMAVPGRRRRRGCRSPDAGRRDRSPSGPRGHVRDRRTTRCRRIPSGRPSTNVLAAS